MKLKKLLSLILAIIMVISLFDPIIVSHAEITVNAKQALIEELNKYLDPDLQLQLNENGDIVSSSNDPWGDPYVVIWDEVTDSLELLAHANKDTDGNYTAKYGIIARYIKHLCPDVQPYILQSSKLIAEDADGRDDELDGEAIGIAVEIVRASLYAVNEMKSFKDTGVDSAIDGIGSIHQFS